MIWLGKTGDFHFFPASGWPGACVFGFGKLSDCGATAGSTRAGAPLPRPAVARALGRVHRAACRFFARRSSSRSARRTRRPPARRDCRSAASSCARASQLARRVRERAAARLRRHLRRGDGRRLGLQPNGIGSLFISEIGALGQPERRRPKSSTRTPSRGCSLSSPCSSPPRRFSPSSPSCSLDPRARPHEAVAVSEGLAPRRSLTRVGLRRFVRRPVAVTALAVLLAPDRRRARAGLARDGADAIDLAGREERAVARPPVRHGPHRPRRRSTGRSTGCARPTRSGSPPPASRSFLGVPARPARRLLRRLARRDADARRRSRDGVSRDRLHPRGVRPLPSGVAAHADPRVRAFMWTMVARAVRAHVSACARPNSSRRRARSERRRRGFSCAISSRTRSARSSSPARR